MNVGSMKRRIEGIVLDAVLVAGSVFYLLSPAVYTYFSEAEMTYSKVPKWLAATPPARITARVFDRYNASAPRAVRFNRQLSCFLIAEGSRRGAGCTHEIRRGEAVHGPADLKIASGRYVAEFDFSTNDVCTGGDAHLQVVTAGRFGRVLANYAGPIVPGQRIALPFQLKLMDAALAPVEFRVSGMGNCVVLSRVGWTQTSLNAE